MNGTTGQSYTYKDSADKCRVFAAGLHNMLEADKGDVLAILLPNCPEYAFAFAGASALGVTVTTVNPLYTPQEVARQFEMSRTKIVVTTDAMVPKVREAQDKVALGKKLFVIWCLLIATRRRTHNEKVGQVVVAAAAAAEAAIGN